MTLIYCRWLNQTFDYLEFPKNCRHNIDMNAKVGRLNKCCNCDHSPQLDTKTPKELLKQLQDIERKDYEINRTFAGKEII